LHDELKIQPVDVAITIAIAKRAAIAADRQAGAIIRADIRFIEYTVAVTIGIAFVAETIAVIICLSWICDAWAVVADVDSTIAVGIKLWLALIRDFVIITVPAYC